MISRQNAERIAQAINVVRPDWRIDSLITLICRDLEAWPLLDLGAGLMYVALDRNTDGSWASQTPARIKQTGPWRHIGVVDPELEQYRARQHRELEQRRAEHRARLAAIDACDLCEPTGYLPNGRVCIHDPDTQERARAGRQLVVAHLRQQRATTTTTTSEQP